jgi:D-glycero-D-manno-heptose 1,7-bisphosphate phosphatase
VFLDRDGVIVEEVGYLHRLESMRLHEGAAEAVAALSRAGYVIVVVTNQAGVGRGYYTWREFEAIEAAIETKVVEAGGVVDGVWACGYHPKGIGYLASDHEWRKPRPGMILDAASRLLIDLARSWMIGDKTLDIEAGVNAGLGNAILVMTGYGAAMREEVERRAENEWRGRCRVETAASLAGAAALILRPRETAFLDFSR